ncbi:MAG: hypothetical protein KDA97_04435 [Acidimicrobiales bacterium]|nr:hypothetical protein [Acidimicrobiales bacterium]
MPNATFMNFDQGMDITNTGAITIASPEVEGSAATNAVGDHLRIRSFGGASHYVIDIQGYFSPFEPPTMETASAAGPARYVPIVPCRIVDTRQAGGPLADREIREVTVAGDGPAFAAQGGLAGGCDIPNGTVAIEASITAVDPADSGFFRAWPYGESLPNATFMNFDQGMDITNTGSVTISTPDFYDDTATTDHLRIRNYGGTSHYVVDIQGYHFAEQLDDK